MKIEVTVSKIDWNKPTLTLTVNGEIQDSYYLYNSRKITNTQEHNWLGIFTTCTSKPVWFVRGDTQVTVDFGGAWELSSHANPASEIARRIALVNTAFDEVKESYSKSWTISITNSMAAQTLSERLLFLIERFIKFGRSGKL
jgi:hypothetical protein